MPPPCSRPSRASGPRGNAFMPRRGGAHPFRSRAVPAKRRRRRQGGSQPRRCPNRRARVPRPSIATGSTRQCRRRHGRRKHVRRSRLDKGRQGGEQGERRHASRRGERSRRSRAGKARHPAISTTAAPAQARASCPPRPRVGLTGRAWDGGAKQGRVPCRADALTTPASTYLIKSLRAWRSRKRLPRPRDRRCPSQIRNSTQPVEITTASGRRSVRSVA